MAADATSISADLTGPDASHMGAVGAIAACVVIAGGAAALAVVLRRRRRKLQARLAYRRQQSTGVHVAVTVPLGHIYNEPGEAKPAAQLSGLMSVSAGETTDDTADTSENAADGTEPDEAAAPHSGP